MPDVGFFIFCCHPLVTCENTAYSGTKDLLKTPFPIILVNYDGNAISVGGR